jgi:hypothetical protein
VAQCDWHRHLPALLDHGIDGSLRHPATINLSVNILSVPLSSIYNILSVPLLFRCHDALSLVSFLVLVERGV